MSGGARTIIVNWVGGKGQCGGADWGWGQHCEGEVVMRRMSTPPMQTSNKNIRWQQWGEQVHPSPLHLEVPHGHGYANQQFKTGTIW